MVQGFFDDDSAPTLHLRGNCRENKIPPPPPPLLPHVYLHPITERESSSRPMAWRGREILLCDWMEVHVGSPVLCSRQDNRRGGERGSHTYDDNCHASEEMAPICYQIISVPLYIPFSFMLRTVIVVCTSFGRSLIDEFCTYVLYTHIVQYIKQYNTNFQTAFF